MKSLKEELFNYFSTCSQSTAKQAHTHLTSLYGENIASASTVTRLYRQFRAGGAAAVPFQDSNKQLPENCALPPTMAPSCNTLDKENLDPRADFEHSPINQVPANTESDEETELDSDFEPTLPEIMPKLSRPTKRAFILQHFLQKRSPSEAHTKLNSTLGAGHFNLQTVKQWYKRFQRGDYTCKDMKKSGRPKQVSDQELISYIESHQTALSVEIAQEFGYSVSTVHKRLHKCGYSLKLDKWVPYNLSTKNKDQRVAICRQLLDKLKENPFLG